MPKQHYGHSFISNHDCILGLLSLNQSGRVEHVRCPAGDEMRLWRKFVSFICDFFASCRRICRIVTFADKISATLSSAI